MSDTCPRCGADKHRGRCKKKGRGRVVETPVEEAPAPVKRNGHSLEMIRGYGFRASAEDGVLVIEQDGDEQTVTLVLAPHEARALLEWIASHAP